MDSSLSFLAGRQLVEVLFDDQTRDWVFVFTGDVALRVGCPWRVTADGNILVGWRDDGQAFGRLAPCDARAQLQSLLTPLGIETAGVRPHGDITIDFSRGARLEAFNDSCGYEGWQLYGPEGEQIIAQGGGTVVGLVS